MSAILAREPVRIYVYGVLVALLALLVGYGVIDGDAAALWLGLGVAVASVPAVEGLRSQVSPARHVTTFGVDKG